MLSNISSKKTLKNSRKSKSYEQDRDGIWRNESNVVETGQSNETPTKTSQKQDSVNFLTKQFSRLKSIDHTWTNPRLRRKS